MGAKAQGADATAGRWLTVSRTLCFVLNGDDVLLMKRSPERRVFPNKYNGVGGHIERHEDPLTSARREILEETGLIVHDARLRAVYNIDAGESTGIMLFAFTAVSHSREVVADEREGTLHWIPRNKVFELDLVEDLRTMLPLLLAMNPADAPLFVHTRYDAHDAIQLRIAEAD
jgi:8-oxo-dGTP diphosphatase